MPSISIKAHFDGERIQLDEPVSLPRNTPLLVTVLTDSAVDRDRLGLSPMAVESLARAYGDKEPDYSATDLL